MSEYLQHLVYKAYMVGKRHEARFNDISRESDQMLKKRILKLSTILFCAVGIALASNTRAQSKDSEEVVSGEALFSTCAFCHGPQGQGGPALDAPPIAGMQAWYVERQLNLFQGRLRGMHPEDISGLQMSIVSGMARDDATVKNIAAYIESMDPNPAPEMVNGTVAPSDRAFLWVSEYADLIHPEPANAEKGAKIYASTCMACHGVAAQGNEGLGAPKLSTLPDWYMHRQLQYFKNGVRGADSKDIYGKQMSTFAKILADNQGIADVVAYIETL